MSWIVLLIVVIVFAVVLAVKPMSMWKNPLPEGEGNTPLNVALGCLIFLSLPLSLTVLRFLLESGRWELCAWVAVLTGEYLLARRIQYALATKPEQWWRNATAADVRSALRRGADVNAMNGAALQMAACYSDAAVVELLIEKGADMTQTNMGNGRFSGTPLHSSAYHGNIPAIAVLLDRGADINASSHGTPLWYAARAGNVGAISMLLDRGADTKSSLESAVLWDNWAAAGMLLLSREAAEDGLAPCVTGLSASGSCRARMQPALELCPTCATPQWFFCPSCSRRVRGQQFEEPGEWRREPDKLVSAGDCIPCDLAGVRSWKAVPPNIKERLIGWGLKPPAIQPPRSARFPTSKPRGQSTRRDRSAVNRSGGEGAKYGVGAIPTRFRGRLYRSRLEARWAALCLYAGGSTNTSRWT